MSIEKLPSGSYRLRKNYKGRTYSIVLDYKPKKAEAERILFDLIDKGNDLPVSHSRMTFTQAAEKCIETKADVLSVTTVRSYRSSLRNLPQWFQALALADITQEDVQRAISELSARPARAGGTLSPKTLRNRHGFISTVLELYKPSLVLKTVLPPRKKAAVYVPDDGDVQRLLQSIKGTKYEIPLILAAFGLRRSEICALDVADVEPGIIHVRRTKLLNSQMEWVTVDRTKTPESCRTVYVPEYVTDLILRQGYVYQGSPNSLYKYLQKVLKREGISTFPLHKLRHYFASSAHALGVPDAYIMAEGGWKTDNVLKSVYRHALNDRVREMADVSIKHFEGML